VQRVQLNLQNSLISHRGGRGQQDDWKVQFDAETVISDPCAPRYLQEVGYTDTILDVKSQRVRALLGLTGDSGGRPSEKKSELMVNGTDPSSMKDSGVDSRKP